MTPDLFAGMYGGFQPRFEGADRVGAKAVRFEKFMQFYNFGSTYFQTLAGAGDPMAQQRMDALFRAWEPYVEGISDQERDVIFGEGDQQQLALPPPAPPEAGGPMANAQIPPNQVQTPVMNREMQNQGA